MWRYYRIGKFRTNQMAVKMGQNVITHCLAVGLLNRSKIAVIVIDFNYFSNFSISLNQQHFDTITKQAWNFRLVFFWCRNTNIWEIANIWEIWCWSFGFFMHGVFVGPNLGL